MNKDVIKPCKCGYANAQLIGYWPVGFLIDCASCGYFTKTYSSETLALKAWNRRSEG